MRRLSPPCLGLLAVFAALACGCSRSQSTAVAAAPQGTTSPSPAALALAYDKPAVVGTRVRATASGLPAGKIVELPGPVTGGWVVEDYYHFRGKKYARARSRWAVSVDAGGG